MAEKERLDNLLFNRGMAESRAKARGLIMAGEVSVDGKVIDKPGTRFVDTVEITLREQPRFVSRGGEKLDAALKYFDIDVSGRIAADVGASTGGFTDCLLQRDAALVYAIDVGYGQLAHKLRIDPRVVVMERTNARTLEALPQMVNCVVIDASYISLRLLLPSVRRWLASYADLVLLIKPQFEAGRDDVGKGGLVRDPSVHARVLEDVLSSSEELGLTLRGLMVSPIKGAKSGNTEYLVWFSWPAEPHRAIDRAGLIDNVLGGR